MSEPIEIDVPGSRYVVVWVRDKGSRKVAFIKWRAPSTGELESVTPEPITPQQAEAMAEVLSIGDDDLYPDLLPQDLIDDDEIQIQEADFAVL